jgi:murein DD-endopeptidase MepM/ murein hydrolase activator NlpD
MSKKFTTVVSALLAAVLLLSLVLCVLPTDASASAESDLQALRDQQEELQQQQEEAQARIDELKNSQASCLEQKQALEEQINATRSSIENLQQQIDVYTKQISEKAKELTEKEAIRDEQLAKLKVRLRAMEENGRYSYLEVLLQVKSLSDLLSKMDDIAEIATSDKELEESYKQAAQECADVKKQLEDNQAQLQTRQDELTTEKKNLESQQTEVESVISDLQASIDANQAEYDELAAKEEEAAAAANALVEQIEAERRSAEENNSSGSGSGDSGSGGGTVGSGVLQCPLGWYVLTSSFGYRESPTTGASSYHQGIDMGADEGDPIYAADSGTVTLAGWYGGYGNCVIINHGNGMVTLYGHMSSIACYEGQSVSRGEVIGYVGETGVATGPHLHFSLWIDGVPTDPLPYI